MFNYDRREDGVYLLTGKKAKEKDIVIKMGSSVSEIHLSDAMTRNAYKLLWTIEADDLEDTDTIVLRGKIDGAEHSVQMDATKIVNELSSMVIKNQTLDSCETLNNALEEGFNDIFLHMLDTKGAFLCSAQPIKAYVVLRHKGKMIGGASRFSFNAGILNIYEYVGKDINRDMELTADVIVGNCKVTFVLNAQRDVLYEIYDSNMHTLGYFNYSARIRNIVDNNGYDYVEVPEIAPLKVPKSLTNANDMNGYIKRHNSLNDIDKYRISLKPKVQIININNFMLREFTI